MAAAMKKLSMHLPQASQSTTMSEASQILNRLPDAARGCQLATLLKLSPEQPTMVFPAHCCAVGKRQKRRLQSQHAQNAPISSTCAEQQARRKDLCQSVTMMSNVAGRLALAASSLPFQALLRPLYS